MKYNCIGEKINEYKMNSTYLNYRPLFDALNHGKHKEAVNRLLEIGPLFDPNVTPYSSGDSLLHVTCRLGRTDFLLHLIENYGNTSLLKHAKIMPKSMCQMEYKITWRDMFYAHL